MNEGNKNLISFSFTHSIMLSTYEWFFKKNVNICVLFNNLPQPFVTRTIHDTYANHLNKEISRCTFPKYALQMFANHCSYSDARNTIHIFAASRDRCKLARAKAHIKTIAARIRSLSFVQVSMREQFGKEFIVQMNGGLIYFNKIARRRLKLEEFRIFWAKISTFPIRVSDYFEVVNIKRNIKTSKYLVMLSTFFWL